MPRQTSPTDLIFSRLQDALGLLHPPATTRTYPAESKSELALAPDDLQHSIGLMRINHAGEVAAQALYHGQALTARSSDTRQHLLDAAVEEAAHLHWCEHRLKELSAKPSQFQPLWYAGSFAIGAVAGLTGDRWSLGFVEETERQVTAHLDEHLQHLSDDDQRSRAILETMREDEARHGAEAKAAGAQALPEPIRVVMKTMADCMKFIAYRM